ncbi:MAG TPA: sulfite exporter TauE/SafE family protein, partial [Candidatus Limnocylindrales bacterium]
MSPFEAVVIMAAGFAAGTINTIVGSGSLITFPTLLFFGFPPIVANVSNTVGLVPGTASGAIGYRRELPPADRGFVLLVVLAIAGGLTGAVLLLALPSTTFEVIVPYLILIASGLMAVQPYLTRALASRRGDGRSHGLVFDGLIYLTSIYGGYFGAAQGVLFISLLSIFQPGNLQRSNAVKNVLALCTNTVA